VFKRIVVRGSCCAIPCSGVRGRPPIVGMYPIVGSLRGSPGGGMRASPPIGGMCVLGGLSFLTILACEAACDVLAWDALTLHIVTRLLSLEGAALGFIEGELLTG
jgi:hypothetical protein